MAQPSAEDVAKFLDVAPDDPMVLEHLAAASQIDDAAARTARRLGDSGAPGTNSWTRILSRRARRGANRAPAPPPPTPDSCDDEAAAPATARGRLLQSAGATAVRRRAKTPATRRPQPDAGKLTRSGPRKQRKAKDDDDDEMSSERPLSAESAATAPVQSDSTGDALDVLAHGVDRRCSLTRKDAPDALTAFATEPTEAKAMDTSDESLDNWARLRKVTSVESLSKMPPAELLRVADELKLLAEAVMRGSYVNTCASLDTNQPTAALAVKVIRSLAGLVGIDDALAVFDAKEEDVVERARSREATLRADATYVKEAKARAAEEARLAALASAKAAPKSVKKVVTELGLSFKMRPKCSQACVNKRRNETGLVCTCKASNSWSSSVKLVDIKGKTRVTLYFDSGTPYVVYSLSALKSRFRPAGGGSGEEAVARLQEAARAARDKAGWKGDVNLASE